MNKKLMNTMVILLAVILLAGAVIYITMLKGEKSTETEEPSIDEVLKVSVNVPEMTTNLQSKDYVKISFTVQTDGKKAKEEFEKRSFQVQNLIISELSETNAVDLEGKEGKMKLEETIKMKVNELMQEGKVVKVYITSYIIS